MSNVKAKRYAAHSMDPRRYTRELLDELLLEIGDGTESRWEMKLILDQFMNAWSYRAGTNSHVKTLFFMLEATRELLIEEDERIRRMQVDVDWFTIAEQLKPRYRGPIEVLEAWEELSDRPEPPHETSAYF
ncbi:hypothetical protein [Paramicrobacterium fandaimingii]|uniref:hypothetical protein n=1 Tax=Paramicrobacterium fandaimingii TaxID=2708079 RepID=UPI0014206AF6|nr:hypothetical protein [Microbacterium fandaimingii]